MSKEDPYLDGNCLRIHTKSAFIEFQKSPGLTFTQVRQHHKGESSDVKELTNVTEDIYWKHLLEQTCLKMLLGYLKSLPGISSTVPLVPLSYPYIVICSFESGFCDSAPVGRDDK